jgi:uncharacterized integral membrane protein
MKPKTTLVLLCGLIALIVMLQNTQTVTVHILLWQIMLPQILLIFLMLLLGLMIGYLLGTLKGATPKYFRQEY